MQDQRRRIVVLTPVRNEGWILDRFLNVTSRFADLIIIADQNSTDETVSICKRFDKVHLIQNTNPDYDEATRQILLIETARKLVPEEKILLALDCDEILAANALETSGWQTMLNAPRGTVLVFEKPDLYVDPDRCLRGQFDWPGGYVDDGAQHTPQKVHSIRIPMPTGAPRLIIRDVKFLHYALLRPRAQIAKRRMYCVIENISKTKTAYQRRRYYDARADLTKPLRPEASNPDWFRGWERLGIDMRTVHDQEYYWQDYETLDYLVRYGSYRFWLDDIWEMDWKKLAADIGAKRISVPPVLLQRACRLFYGVLFRLADLRRQLFLKKSEAEV